MKNILFACIILLASCSGEEPKKIPHISMKKHPDTTGGKPMGMQNIHASRMDDSIVDAALQPVDTLVDDFRFVIGNQFIVLQTSMDTTIAKGDPGMAENSFDPVCETRDVRMEQVSDSMKNYLGREYYMVAANGGIYPAKIAKLKLMTIFFPWDEMFYSEEGNALDSAEVRWAYWHEGIQFSSVLVGVVDTIAPGKEVVGAIPVVAGKLPMFLITDTTDALKPMISEAFTETHSYAKIKEDYLTSLHGQTPNEEWTVSENVSDFFTARGSGGNFCTMSISAGDLCGGEFYGEMNGAWKIGADKKPELLFSVPMFTSTKMMIDIDADGTPEILTTDWSDGMTLYRKVNGGWRAYTHFGMMDMRCPC